MQEPAGAGRGRAGLQLSALARLPVDEKKSRGALINRTKERIEAALAVELDELACNGGAGRRAGPHQRRTGGRYFATSSS